MSDVVELGPHINMTPAEVLAFAAREPWKHVIVVGFWTDDHKDTDLVVRSSKMNRQWAFWIAEHLKLYTLDRLG